MPIDYKSHPVVQTVVSSQGDISAQTFGPEGCEGRAWLLLQEGSPRRPQHPQLRPQRLDLQEGVFIGADDPQALDPIIDALLDMRQRLAKRPPLDTPPTPAGHPKVFPLQLTSEETYFSHTKGTTKVIIWPRGFGTPRLAGAVVSIDGETWRVISVETEEPFQAGARVSLVVAPWTTTPPQ